MTVVVVMVDPPRPGLALPELAATTPLSEAEAADLYAGMIKDTVIAVRESGGDLMMNYRPDDLLPEEYHSETSATAEIRALVADVVEEVSTVRFEPQVGSDLSARAGNTVTHLLRDEGADSVAILPGTAPLLTRATIDTAAVNLRRAPVVLGPATDGRVHYAGFTEPIDFADALVDPVLPTLAERATDTGLDTTFIDLSPVVERGSDLLTLLPMLRARNAAEKAVPAYTTALLEQFDLDVVYDEDGSGLVRA